LKEQIKNFLLNRIIIVILLATKYINLHPW